MLVLETTEVYFDARTHCGGNGDAFDISAFDAAWLDTVQARKEHFGILGQFGGAKAYFANTLVNNALFVDTVFNTTGFSLFDCFGDIGSDGTALWVRHEAARTKQTRVFTKTRHHLWCGDENVEVELLFIEKL